MGKGSGCGKIVQKLHCFGGTQGFARAVLLSVNILFGLFGFVLFVAAIFAASLAEQFEEDVQILKNLDLSSVSWTVMIMALFTVLLAAAGFFGSYKTQHIGLLKVYMVLLTMVAAVQLAFGIFISQSDVDDLEPYWFDYEALQGEDTAPIHNLQREDFQQWLGCCGWSYTWDSLSQGTECLTLEPAPCSTFDPNFCDTCRDATKVWIDSNVIYVGIIALILSLLEFIGLVAACIRVFGSAKVKGEYFDNEFRA